MANLGRVHFPVSCAPAALPLFARGVALLHSFWFDEATRAFQEVVAADPSCTMGYWGIAMSFYHPLWTSPDDATLAAGSAAVQRAKALGPKTARERAYIGAIESFYADWGDADHGTRARRYERAMGNVHAAYPDDVEAAAFYALALIADAPPADKTLEYQRKAGAICERIFAAQPDHPGAAHYIIHAYDYPSLAARALPAARRYAHIAPFSPHALHMPSHTFSQLGLWQESIDSNVASEGAAKAYALRVHLAGAWEEQLHAMEYLEYAYLQFARDAEAESVRDELLSIQRVVPARSRKAAYALAAIPARFALERRQWRDAASLVDQPGPFPRAASLTYFARGYAKARLGDVEGSRVEARHLADARARLEVHSEEGTTAAALVEVQRILVEGWIAHVRGRDAEALRLVRSAADLEDRTDDGPVTPGPVVRARDVLGDLLLELHRPADALAAFRASLVAAPARFAATFGATCAARRAGQRDEAAVFIRELRRLCTQATCNRSEVIAELSAP